MIEGERERLQSSGRRVESGGFSYLSTEDSFIIRMDSVETDPLRQLKAALRREARRRREALDPAWRAAAAAAIREGILALPEVRAEGTRNISVFASFGSEIDTYPLLERIIEKHGGVLLPRVVADAGGAGGGRRLEFRRVNDLGKGLAPAYQGIPEPDPDVYPETVAAGEMDLIVVPGLIFDRRGFRLGYGGGFYDRLLAGARRCRAVGIVYGPLLGEEPLPAGEYDRPVDAIVTEAGLIEIKPR